MLPCHIKTTQSTGSIGKGSVASIGSREERSQKIVKVTTWRWNTDERWEQEKVEESTAVFIVAVVCVTVYHDVPRKGQRVRAKRVDRRNVTNFEHVFSQQINLFFGGDCCIIIV